MLSLNESMGEMRSKQEKIEEKVKSLEVRVFNTFEKSGSDITITNSGNWLITLVQMNSTEPF